MSNTTPSNKPPSPLTITITDEGAWFDWTVDNDDNARAPYCGATRAGWHEALESALQAIAYKKRHPYQPSVRTEY